MSHVEIRQIGHVAAKPVIETLTVKGREQTKALVTVISNARWKDAEGNAREKSTAIIWTLWGAAAMNASWYLDVGSKVAMSGTLESRRYSSKEGKEVFTFGFTARSVEYLDSKAEAEARRKRRADLSREPVANADLDAGKSSSSVATAKGA